MSLHIPGGILTPAAWQATAIAASFVLAASIRATLAAPSAGSQAKAVAVTLALFILQMLTLPGTALLPGHIVGTFAASLVVGAPTASVAMATTLVIQALVFGDGGIEALGANFITLGVVAVYAGRYVFDAVRTLGRDFLWSALAAFVAGSFSMAAVCAAVGAVTGIGKPAGVLDGVTAMVTGSGVAIVVEGVLTCLLYMFLRRFNPELLARQISGNRP